MEKSDLDLLTQELRPAQHKWKSIGDELPYGYSADDIRHQYSDDGDRLREILRLNLQLFTNTWRNIVDALRSPGIGHSQLADQLEAKYCPSEYTNNNIRYFFDQTSQATIILIVRFSVAIIRGRIATTATCG